MWNYNGSQRPDFADAPGPGQESVWDYPRPPVLRTDRRKVKVAGAGKIIAISNRAIRLCETASPPSFYIPPGEVDWSLLESIGRGSYCEWKGSAEYWSLRQGPDAKPIGWSYPRPRPSFARIAGFISFYPGRVACEVNGQPVTPQAGRFYGGWITDELVGPFKGAPGTGHW